MAPDAASRGCGDDGRSYDGGLLRALAEANISSADLPFRTQVGALCYKVEDGGHMVLLITSRGTGRWVIPKGWPMKKLKPHEAAAIEAQQEAGIRGKIRRKAVGRYTYLKRLEDGRDVPCVVDLFPLEVSGMDDDFKEKGQRAAKWFSAAEAARLVQEPELRSILINFGQSRPR